MVSGKMATKEKVNSENVGEQQQPVVDRDKVKTEREARRLAKLAAKQKLQDKSRNLSVDDEKKADGKKETPPKQTSKQVTSTKKTSSKVDSSVSDKKSHRKEQTPVKGDSRKENTTTSPEKLTEELEKMEIRSDSKQSKAGASEKLEKKQLTKAERRAIQEAQRAAKGSKTTEKSTPQTTKKESNEPKVGASVKSKSDNHTSSKSNKSSSGRNVIKRSPQQQHRVKLFNHLYTDILPVTLVNSNDIHPAIVRLGVQYSSGVVKGCNARGLAFMNSIKSVIDEYETPSQKEFARGLEDVIKTCGNYLQQCRPLAVSVTNAMKFIQFQLRQLPKSESDAQVRNRLTSSLLKSI